MAKISPILLVPSDAPPSIEYVKKLCIFFPKIILPHYDDQALIHERDIIERFPDFEIFWAEGNTYPRSDDYVNTIGDIITSSSIMQKRGAIQILSKEDIKKAIDPGIHYVTFMSVTTDKALVTSAIPDARNDFKPKWTGYIRGFELTQKGYVSKYSQIGLGEAAVVANVPEEWSYVGHLRLGRFFKYNTIASIYGYNSYYYDAINDSIGRSVNKEIDKQDINCDNLSDYLFSSLMLDAVEIKDIENMSWLDVLEVRRRVLPEYSKLLDFFEKKQARLAKLNRQSDSIYDFMDGVQNEYAKIKDEYKEALYKLGVGSLFKFAGASLGGGITTLMTTGNPQNYVMGMAASLGLFAVGMYKEIIEVMIKRKKINNHRLHFLDSVIK